MRTIFMLGHLMAAGLLLAACSGGGGAANPPPMDAPLRGALAYTPITGSTYYVDYQNGDDHGSGLSPAQAWKHSPGDQNATGDPRAAQLQPGDGVILKGGVTYRGTISVNTAGTAEQPIVIDGNSAGGFGSGKAIIDGSELLTGWEPTTINGREGYVTDLPEGASLFSLNLYAGSHKMSIAQGPTPSDYYAPDNRHEYFQIPPEQVSLSSITDRDTLQGLFPNGEFRPAYVALWANDNRIVRSRITAYDAKTGTIHFDPVNSIYTGRTNFYAIFNHPSVLQEPGEYLVFEPDGEIGGKIYLVPFPGFEPAAADITHSVRPFGLDIRRGHVTAQHLVAQKHVGVANGYHQGGGIRAYANNAKLPGIVLQGNEVRYNSSYNKYGAIYTRNTADLRVTHNHVHHNYPNRGIMLTSGERTRALENLVEGGGHTGLTFFGTTDGVMAYNRVRDVTAVHANGISIYLDSHRNLIFANHVERGNIALTIKHSKFVTVAHNILHTDRDLYTMIDWGAGAGNLRYLNNLIINKYGKGLAVNSSSLAGLEVRNNIIDGNLIRETGDHITNNVYTRLGWTQHPKYGYEITHGNREADADEVFVDYAGGDYRIKPGAPLTPAERLEFSHDFLGQPITAPFAGPYAP